MLVFTAYRYHEAEVRGDEVLESALVSYAHAGQELALLRQGEQAVLPDLAQI